MIIDDIVVEENIVVQFDNHVDQAEAGSLPKESVGAEDRDALFEQLLRKSEANMSSKSSTQQSQSYSPPLLASDILLFCSCALKILLALDLIPKNKLLTNEVEQSIRKTGDVQHIKPLTTPLSKLQKEKVDLPIFGSIGSMMTISMHPS